VTDFIEHKAKYDALEKEFKIAAFSERADKIEKRKAELLNDIDETAPILAKKIDNFIVAWRELREFGPKNAALEELSGSGFLATIILGKFKNGEPLHIEYDSRHFLNSAVDSARKRTNDIVVEEVDND